MAFIFKDALGEENCNFSKNISEEYRENICSWLSTSVPCVSFLKPNRRYTYFKDITVCFAILPELCSKYD